MQYLIVHNTIVSPGFMYVCITYNEPQPNISFKKKRETHWKQLHHDKTHF